MCDGTALKNSWLPSRAEETGACVTEFELRPSIEGRVGWDQFAQRSRATFRSAYRLGFIWQFRDHFSFSFRRFDVLKNGLGPQFKIAQFAIGTGPHLKVFNDCIQILPGYEHEWAAIMRHILRYLGSGNYRYGSEWTTEPSRSSEIEAMVGCKITAVKKLEVYAVDFSDYPSWTSYHQALSKNARRNEAMGRRDESGGLSTSYGLGSLLNGGYLLRLKIRMFRRKKLPLGLFRGLLALLIRHAIYSRYLFTAKFTRRRDVVSLYCGVLFGSNSYYLEGASISDPKGGAWLLLIAMLQQAYIDTNGVGKCLLGPDDGTEKDQTAWENLRRQRLQCRAVAHQTSLLSFTYNQSRFDDA